MQNPASFWTLDRPLGVGGVAHWIACSATAIFGWLQPLLPGVVERHAG